uniref:Uncharacterized protein n=1 Tax=Pediastrum angulosum TaxID=271408 RepID=A0A2U8GHI2_9CHLO|nr:hypothetical protein [Pediastrum angulosum]AWI68136.1 hypothetical protein [Pediastrum angulosum]
MNSATLVIIELTYGVDLSQRSLKTMKTTEHTVVFSLVPEGELECSMVTFLDAVRDQLYNKLRKIQQKGVVYHRIRIKIQGLEQPIEDDAGFAANTVKSAEAQTYEFGFTGRGLVDIGQVNLGQDELKVLSRTLDFACIFIVSASESLRDTNRFSVLGHCFLTGESLFSDTPFGYGTMGNFVEGSPRPEIIDFILLFTNGFVVNGVKFNFYDRFRGGDNFRKIAYLTLVGLRDTSKTARKQ